MFSVAFLSGAFRVSNGRFRYLNGGKRCRTSKVINLALGPLEGDILFSVAPLGGLSVCEVYS